MAVVPRRTSVVVTSALALGVSGLLISGCQTAPSAAETSARAALAATPSATGSTGPAPTPSTSSKASPKPTPTKASAAAGITIEPGTYVMWKKSRDLVLLVRDGKVVRTMPTTDLDYKTPKGNYHVGFKNRVATAVDGGVFYHLDYFVEYGPVPGHTNIGFHQVPVTPKGVYIQPLSSVGTAGGKYSSHGCERLRPADAKAVWDFTKVGTQVRVR